MPANGPRVYGLILDTNSYPAFGLEDGTRYYGIKPYNPFSVGGANADSSAGWFAEMGVKDNDLWQALSLGNSYIVRTPANSPNTDVTIDFGVVVKQILIDNSANSNVCYVEYADIAASTSSPQIISGSKELIPIFSQKIHIYSTTPALVIVRGWS